MYNMEIVRTSVSLKIVSNRIKGMIASRKMDSTKITELVRDYLYLTSRHLYRKTEYRHRNNLLLNVLTGMIDYDCECYFGHEPNCHRKVIYEKTEWTDELFREYLHLVTECISDHLEDKIKPYVCPGSGDKYRNYIIHHKDSVFIVKCVGENPSEKSLKEWFKDMFYYPLEINCERVESVDGGPNWRK